jgi:uncharacterized repeat protein (TIGR01451 family)
VLREVVKATGDIITVAGSGTAGYSGDGGLATTAELDFPDGVAVDSAGDLFIADAHNNRIREVVKATGDIIIVAGSGTAGYGGDHGTAIAAELNDPDGVAVDSAGDLFIADTDNNRIREVLKATGDIITVAGDGTAGYNGDNGLATDAELNRPQNVAFDSLGDMFIADFANFRIREVVKATGDIITVAGNGTSGYSGAGGPAIAAELHGGRITLDSAGDVFINNFFGMVVSEFTTSATVAIAPAPQADLAVGVTAQPPQVNLGGKATYIVTLTNNGPNDAQGVALTDILPSGASVVSVMASMGSPTTSGSTITLDLATLVDAASVTLTIVVTPSTKGT